MENEGILYFSKSTVGFYDRDIHGDDIPDDAVEITRAKHNEMLEGQSNGKIIKADANGRPILADPDPLSYEQLLGIARGNRAQAYSREADPIFFKSQRGEASREDWIAKIEEIKAKFPDPVSE